MLYSYIVKKLIRQSFDHVNNHRWDELLKPVAPNVHHRFAGAHSIGGERHGKEAMRTAGWSASAASCPISISRSTTVKGLAVAYHRVCAVGRHRNAAQRRRFVLQPRLPRDHHALGQSVCAGCV